MLKTKFTASLCFNILKNCNWIYRCLDITMYVNKFNRFFEKHFDTLSKTFLAAIFLHYNSAVGSIPFH